jgi:hypothetical protein
LDFLDSVKKCNFFMFFGVGENEKKALFFKKFLDSVKIWFRSVKNWKIKIFWCQRKCIFRQFFYLFSGLCQNLISQCKIWIFWKFGVSENKVRMRSIYKRGWKIENWENKSSVKLKNEVLWVLSVFLTESALRVLFWRGQNPHFLKK